MVKKAVASRTWQPLWAQPGVFLWGALHCHLPQTPADSLTQQVTVIGLAHWRRLEMSGYLCPCVCDSVFGMDTCALQCVLDSNGLFECEVCQYGVMTLSVSLLSLHPEMLSCESSGQRSSYGVHTIFWHPRQSKALQSGSQIVLIDESKRHGGGEDMTSRQRLR